MAARKKKERKNGNGSGALGLGAKLWETADRWRDQAPEYKRVVLRLCFMTDVYDGFQERRRVLIEEHAAMGTPT
jgi:hypothetical protein